MTFDDIIFSVMPNLINGKTPSKQTILRVLEDIAYSADKTHWVLRAEKVEPTGSQTALTFESATPIPLLVTPLSISHDEIIYRLSKLAAASGLKPHVGKKEQAGSMLVYGERLATIGGGELPANLTMKGKWEKGKVEQIDCIFFHPLGVPMYAFEVEASTPITTGIDRFLELLPLNQKLSRRLVLVIPKAREKKLSAILRDSHYIGHPMYMENTSDLSLQISGMSRRWMLSSSSIQAPRLAEGANRCSCSSLSMRSRSARKALVAASILGR